MLAGLRHSATSIPVIGFYSSSLSLRREKKNEEKKKRPDETKP